MTELAADPLLLKWLRTADSAKGVQQRQLMLIIDNLDFTMPQKPTLYDDVMNVWTKAMLMLDNLVSGIAQSVASGEALLGLSAWHLYPDMCVAGCTAGNSTMLIEQEDGLLMEGGILTVGLGQGRTKLHTGISWSIPLAHLRFYGRPVECCQTLNSATTRVSTLLGTTYRLKRQSFSQSNFLC